MTEPLCSIPASFSLAQTLDCGQAFRWQPLPGEPGAWQGVAQDKALVVREAQGRLHFSCSQAEFDSSGGDTLIWMKTMRQSARPSAP